jgi:hypothetical protein
MALIAESVRSQSQTGCYPLNCRSNMVNFTGFLRARIVVDNMIGGSAALQ